MVECDKCYKIFNYQCLLEKHKTRKKSCDIPEIAIKNLTLRIEEMNNNINNLENLSIESQTTCNFCNKKFKKKYNLVCHLDKSCAIKKDLIENKTKYDNIIILKNQEITKNNMYDKIYEEKYKEKIYEKKYAIVNNNNINVKMNDNVKLGPLTIDELLKIINATK